MAFTLFLEVYHSEAAMGRGLSRGKREFYTFDLICQNYRMKTNFLML